MCYSSNFSEVPSYLSYLKKKIDRYPSSRTQVPLSTSRGRQGNLVLGPWTTALSTEMDSARLAGEFSLGLCRPYLWSWSLSHLSLFIAFLLLAIRRTTQGQNGWHLHQNKLLASISFSTNFVKYPHTYLLRNLNIHFLHLHCLKSNPFY